MKIVRNNESCSVRTIYWFYFNGGAHAEISNRNKYEY